MLKWRHKAPGDRSQAGGRQAATAEAMAHLGHHHRSDGHPQATHGQQCAETRGSQTLNGRSQADRQHVQRRQQAVEQDQMNHGGSYGWSFTQHLQTRDDLSPDRFIGLGSGLLAHPDRAQTEGRHAVTEGQEQELAPTQPNQLKQVVQAAQDRITKGEPNDRGAHAGGLIERIGCQEMTFGH